MTIRNRFLLWCFGFRRRKANVTPLANWNAPEYTDIFDQNDSLTRVTTPISVWIKCGYWRLKAFILMRDFWK